MAGREREGKNEATLPLCEAVLGREYINIFSLMVLTCWFGYRSPILQKEIDIFVALSLSHGRRLIDGNTIPQVVFLFIYFFGCMRDLYMDHWVEEVISRYCGNKENLVKGSFEEITE